MKKLFFSLFAIILFAISTNAQSGDTSKLFPFGLKFSVKADLVSIDGNGCFTLNVRVYLDDSSGNTLLIASGNSQICERSTPKGIPSADNSKCKNELYKGDYISHPSSKDYKYCLIDCLKSEEVYQQYQTEKYRVLSNVKR